MKNRMMVILIKVLEIIFPPLILAPRLVLRRSLTAKTTAKMAEARDNIATVTRRPRMERCL